MASIDLEFERKYLDDWSEREVDSHCLLTGGYEAKDRATIRKNIGLSEDKCAECLKRFEHTSEHAYRRNEKLFCSYSCMRAFDKKHQIRHGRKKMRTEDRIAALSARLTENQKMLDACTDRTEIKKIQKRMSGYRNKIEKLKSEANE